MGQREQSQEEILNNRRDGGASHPGSEPSDHSQRELILLVGPFIKEVICEENQLEHKVVYFNQLQSCQAQSRSQLMSGQGLNRIR